MKEKVVIVTGANRGLGLGTAEALIAKGYVVVFAGRNEKTLSDIVERQKQPGAHFEILDTAKQNSIDTFAQKISKKFGAVDILINNAGVFLDGREGGDADPFKTSAATVLETFQTNTLGPLLLTQKFLPGMLERNFGRIVNVSSGMGQLSEMDGGYLSYRISKTALNAVTKTFAGATRGKDVLVNSVCPGWVRTDMGTAAAERTIEQGISGILWAATLPKGGPNGGFFRDGKSLPW